jgi:hypothetical protein
MFVPKSGCGEGSIADIAAKGRKMAAGAAGGARGIDMRYVDMHLNRAPGTPPKPAAPAISAAATATARAG